VILWRLDENGCEIPCTFYRSGGKDERGFWGCCQCFNYATHVDEKLGIRKCEEHFTEEDRLAMLGPVHES
jgi:hypothetical protein